MDFSIPLMQKKIKKCPAHTATFTFCPAPMAKACRRRSRQICQSQSSVIGIYFYFFIPTILCFRSQVPDLCKLHVGICHSRQKEFALRCFICSLSHTIEKYMRISNSASINCWFFLRNRRIKQITFCNLKTFSNYHF